VEEPKKKFEAKFASGFMSRDSADHRIPSWGLYGDIFNYAKLVGGIEIDL
jgi:hypothetical protein